MARKAKLKWGISPDSDDVRPYLPEGRRPEGRIHVRSNYSRPPEFMVSRRDINYGLLKLQRDREKEFYHHMFYGIMLVFFLGLSAAGLVLFIFSSVTTLTFGIVFFPWITTLAILIEEVFLSKGFTRRKTALQ